MSEDRTITIYAGWRIKHEDGRIGVVAWNQWGGEPGTVYVWTLANLVDATPIEGWPLSKVRLSESDERTWPVELGDWESR